MAGHSKWSNIKHQKAITDAKKGAQLGRISKEITLAAKLGDSSDPAHNSLLRVAVEKAKALNMTSDRIQKAINKGKGISDGSAALIENTYEILINSTIAVLVDCETDNPNRTLTDIKTIVTKSGYKFLPQGSITWMFEEYGYIKLDILANLYDSNSLLDKLINSIPAIEDCVFQENERSIILYLKKEELKKSLDILKSDFSEVTISEFSIVKLAKEKKEIPEAAEDELHQFITKLEEIPEITNIWTNLK